MKLETKLKMLKLEGELSGTHDGKPQTMKVREPPASERERDIKQRERERERDRPTDRQRGT
jgi:hypothetical protein